MHSQLQGLPAIVYDILPELAQWDLEEEVLADCGKCAMRPRSGEAEKPWHFNKRTHCCTYHPYLANYLVGRALRRKDAGSRNVRQRLQSGEGCTPFGLEPPKAHADRYEATKATGFGHDEALMCPFRAETSLSCSIWQDRNSTCRTWFCKSLKGLPQKLTWNAIRDVLARVEIDLARHCADQICPPAENAGPDIWEVWFIRCATVIDELTPVQADAFRSERLATGVATVEERRRAATDFALPDVLVPGVSSVEPDGEHTRLTGYSRYDGIHVSPDIFSFLSHLDGTSTWQHAARRCYEETRLRVDRALVTQLFALRIIRAPQTNDDPYSPQAASPYRLLSDA